ncbi:hypothetical protein [Streptomyces olivochromogenes]|uniref:hypothetical protein n=1 Tax=Streptomyces olivochromogenes TaxID=1963 RepID=UPI00131D0972|nr:hypothetical protein [Streptomyces olivochromogenes]
MVQESGLADVGRAGDDQRAAHGHATARAKARSTQRGGFTGAFEDTESRVLRGVVGGDLEGVSGWSVRPHGTGSRAVLEQDMVARKALIRRLEVPFRPLFRANHYLLTYRGHRGLKAWLDGGQEAHRAREEDRRSGTRSE